MRLKALHIPVMLAAILLCGSVVQAQKDKEKSFTPGAERTVAADQNVIVSLAVTSGSITVRGWDQREVRVQTSENKRIDFKRGGGEGNAPATRLQVLFSDSSDNSEPMEECGGETDVRLDVPRGATVYVKTQDGDIDVSDIAEARVSTASGDINLRRLSKAVEANTMSGDVSLRNGSGHVRLSSMSGSIEAINVTVLDPSDFVTLKTASGDLLLENIGPARVEAGTISGEVNFTGPLAPGGHYDLKTTSGDITLSLPENSSFKLDAQVFPGGEINSGFPLKQSTTNTSSGRLIGTYGAGDAVINLSSFSGTLRLRKK